MIGSASSPHMQGLSSYPNLRRDITSVSPPSVPSASSQDTTAGPASGGTEDKRIHMSSPTLLSHTQNTGSFKNHQDAKEFIQACPYKKKLVVSV